LGWQSKESTSSKTKLNKARKNKEPPNQTGRLFFFPVMRGEEMNADHFADTEWNEWNDVIEGDTASPDMLRAEEQWTSSDALWDAYNA